MAVPAPTTLARIEEQRLARGVAGIAPTVLPLCGGVMARATPGSWMNKAIAVGLSGPVTSADLETLIGFYGQAGIEPRIELSCFAEPALLDALALAGFVLRRAANCLVAPLPTPRDGPAAERPAGLEVRAVDPADAGEVERFVRTAAAGFARPGREPSEGDLAVWGTTVRKRGTVAMLALMDGRPASAGCLEVDGTHATLFGLSVLPEFRRRGIQQAVIAARLEEAAARGARHATITSDPGGPTERNALRHGFAPSYTRLMLVRPGPGLVPVA